MNSMQMPSQAAGAGLGAMIQAKGSAGAGAPKQTMNEMMALAQKLPDSELADVLAGKSVRVPQFAAMLAAMGRDSLRTAVAGAQAGQAKQPSKKDQMLAKMSPQPEMQMQAPAGLGSIPAPNMEQMGEGMAGGGIVAFAAGGGTDMSKMPTSDLTEAEFNALPKEEQGRRIRAMQDQGLFSSGTGTFLLNAAPALPAAIGAGVTTPFLAAARAALPDQPINKNLPTVGDLYGERGVGGILKRAGEKGLETRYNNAEAKVREGLRTYDPVAEGASPAAQEPDFVGGETGGRAYVGYRKQKGAGSGTPKGREPVLPQQELSALDFDAPVTLPPTVVRSGGDPAFSMEDTAGTTYTPKPGVAPRTNASDPGAVNASAPTGGAPRGTAPGIAPPAAAAPASEARKSFLDGLDEGADDNAKRLAEGKSQAQGEFLMQLGASLLGTPNLGQALQQGVQRGLPGLAASRKEANAILKEQREYKLNMAKAKEAAAQGNDDLAFKYAKLAEDSKYQAGMVAAANMRASGANAFGPKQYQAAMNNAQKEVDAYIAKLGPLEKRKNPPNREQLIEAAFNRNLQAYQSGVIPPAPGIPTVNEIPQGAVTRE